MTTLREAAQQALEALENARDTTYSDTLYAQFEVSITALRAALEQPEQEPVAMCRTWHKGSDQHAELLDWMDALEALPDGEHHLYTHPRREWRGLAEEEIRDLWFWSATVEAERTATTQQHAFARAVEAKLKELNT
jgi:hypothetical protein